MNSKPVYSFVLAAAGLLALSGGASSVQAQSADALIDKLVDKGILSVDEAQSLRDEADKDFTRAMSSKNGMPEWVKTMKINGDFRGRYEGFYDNSENTLVNRSRVRYRARLGFSAGMTDSFEVGLRLASGESNDPISTNQTLTDNGSKKGINIDQAFVRWKGLNTSDMQGALTFGKMENPFVFSDMVFDGDYTPEGLAFNYAYNLNDVHSLKATAGGFSLKELNGNGGSYDSFLLGAQVRWDANWSAHLQTSVGAAFLGIVNDQTLTNGAVPNINNGNTRNGATGLLAANMNPYVLDASATYSLESFPMYAGAFPIKLGADLVQNPGADSDRDTGWSVGVTFGKSGKKGLWDVAYRYKELEADAWYEEMVDSDFGAIKGGSYGSGTNVRGHILKASYSPYDFVTFGATWFITEAIAKPNPATDTTIHRLQVDANFKF